MFVAIASLPSDPAALQAMAGITGLAGAEIARLLAGTLPRVLFRATKDAPGIAAALAGVGCVAFAGDAAAIPTEQDRVVARGLELSSQGLVVLDARGQRHACPAAAIGAFLRGVRRVEARETISSTQQNLAFAKALLTTSPLVLKRVETKGRITATKESFLLIHRRDGLPGLMLYEPRLDYQCLGPAIQPSAFGNFMALLTRLRSLAPHASVDDRITRPGFLAGLPLMAADPLDLALFLVTEAWSRGC